MWGISKAGDNMVIISRDNRDEDQEVQFRVESLSQISMSSVRMEKCLL